MQNFSVSQFPHLHIHPKSAFGSQPVLHLGSVGLLSPHSCCGERVYERMGKQTKLRPLLSFYYIISRFGKSRFSFKLNSLFPGSLWAYAGLSPVPSWSLLCIPQQRNFPFTCSPSTWQSMRMGHCPLGRLESQFFLPTEGNKMLIPLAG